MREKSAVAADHFRFDVAGVRQFGSDDAMAAVFDVITTAFALVQNNPHHFFAVLETLTHLVDLMKVSSEKLGLSRLRNVDFFQRNPDRVFVLIAGTMIVGLAHDVSFLGASGASEEALTTIANATSKPSELCYDSDKTTAPEPYNLSVMVSSFLDLVLHTVARAGKR
jgi:hypothetical protein